MSALTSHALKSHLAGLTLASPLLNASGAFNPPMFNRLFPLQGTLGAIVTKTVTAQPRVGNAQYRTVELPGMGMLNSIGIQNAGLAHFLETEGPGFAALGVPVILSISAESSEAFGAMAHACREHANGSVVAAIELNLSCPNIHAGGVEFGSSPVMVREAVAAVKSVFDRPVFAKLTPNVGDMVPIAAGALEGGADGLTAINTLLGTHIDVKTRRPVLPRVSGGYSGPGVRPVALHHVYRLYQHFPGTPILGVGGIATSEDVLAFMMAGASVVQVGTACFRDPMVFAHVHEELRAWCAREGVAHLQDLVGCAQAH
ncbi:MAG: dihydroorotate dehydrogenase [Candidatus Melainabacteria bacterium]